MSTGFPAIYSPPLLDPTNPMATTYPGDPSTLMPEPAATLDVASLEALAQLLAPEFESSDDIWRFFDGWPAGQMLT